MKTTNESHFGLFQFRDVGTILGFCSIVIGIIAYLGQVSTVSIGSRSASIEVQGLCCSISAQSAQQELAKVSGVIGVIPDYHSQTIHLTLRGSQPTSPQGIWEAIERTSLRPVRLKTEAETFFARPSN
jgi:hypothetical protein